MPLFPRPKWVPPTVRYPLAKNEGRIVLILGEADEELSWTIKGQIYNVWRRCHVLIPQSLHLKDGLAGRVLSEAVTVEHLWVSQKCLEGNPFWDLLGDKPFAVGRVARYIRQDESFDYGITPVSRGEQLDAVLLCYYLRPVSALAKMSSIHDCRGAVWNARHSHLTGISTFLDYYGHDLTALARTGSYNYRQAQSQVSKLEKKLAAKTKLKAKGFATTLYAFLE